LNRTLITLDRTRAERVHHECDRTERTERKGHRASKRHGDPGWTGWLCYHAI